jgi:hypothetical protein
MVEDEVTRSAPVWAASLSKQAQEAVPQGRQKLEEYVLTQVNDTLDKSLFVSDEQFKTFIKNNRNTLEASMKELATSEQLAGATMGELEKSLETQLKGDLESHAKDLFATIKMINERIGKLKQGVNLNTRDQMFRRLLMIGRRLYLNAGLGQSLGSAAGAPASAVVGPVDTPAPAPAGSEGPAALEPSKKKKSRGEK